MVRMSRPSRGVSGRLMASLVITSALITVVGSAPALGAYTPGIPAAVDPGTPTFGGSSTPIPTEPGGAYDPTTNRLQAIYNADIATGGTSFWFDRILARPFLSGDSTSLYTRGRGLYMYTHTPGTLGFAGGYAYRERPTGASQNLYTVAISGATLSETTSARTQFPSYYQATFTATGLSVNEKKFITYNNVAVTYLTITNTGSASTTRTITASSPIATTASGSELTGTVSARYALTTVLPRFSGDSFTVSGTSLTRSVTIGAGASVSFKVQLGALTNELPESSADYTRFRNLSANSAWLTQMAEYNLFWVNNVAYVDIPNKNVEKISYYRTWENLFNSFDGNIPGNDYQFPVDLEGALGYNNQISLTVPMRMQDLKFWRDPLYSFGPWLSQGEESGCQGFKDNPGNTANWNNPFEQWTGQEAWNSYLVHGGPPSIVANLAKYTECDVKGTLARFDTNHNNLVEYSGGTLVGNDADAVAFAFFGARPQDRTETSFWYSSALAAAAEYNLLGNTAKANEMTTIANNIKTAILNTLWADAPVGQGGGATGPRVAGRIGNAVKLSGASEYVTLPTGVVSGLTGNFTIAAWVNPAANTTWSRVFDFGTGTTANMFLTVSAGTAPRFAITTSGSGGEQRLSATSALPLNTWSHVAVTLSGNTGTLYVNGTAVATNTGMTLRPSNLGNTANNWIGRSQYADPFLNATVDDFHIYNSALTQAQIQTLAGGTQGAGNVVAYRFDEASGATATDSSGNGRNGTITGSGSGGTNSCPGKVFLQKDLQSASLVCWKDQQNFAPFIDGIPPNQANYTQALRYYADKAQFPIMPAYTANQADKAAAVAFGSGGSNNFSNINATLQARLFSKALRDYPTANITQDSYRKLIEWLSWNEYINGDNRFPDNNEFFFNWNPTNQTLGRSGIHHDVLGSYNWMFFEDIAGVRARADNVLELYPIDMGYDHFTINNSRYHGSNLTIVWQKPGGTVFYPNAPMGYTAYIDGQRAFTVSDLAHVSWNSATGAVSILDGSATTVSFNAARTLLSASQVSLTGNARLVDAFQKAGVNVSSTPGGPNLALGKTVTASFTTTSPAAQATSPANAVDGFTISGLPVTSGAFVGTNPIWGDSGSPNSQDWLQVNLGSAVQFNTVKLYFYSNKSFGVGGGTYRQPTAYTVQFLNGSTWTDIPGQVRSPATPAPNYNLVTFPAMTAQNIRVLVTRASGLGVGIKEIQVQQN
jgi:hypothetical protein